MILKSIKSLSQTNFCLKQKRVAVPGFTLVEMLVAMVITGIMLTLVMASYWTFLQTQQRMAVSRELQSEVRFALNRVADKVRFSRPNYPEYTGTGDCTTDINYHLCLLGADGTTYLFAYDQAAETLRLGNDPSNIQPLISPQKFKVTGLHFDFSPQNDPSDLSNDQMQPKVTVYIEVSPRSGRYQHVVIANQTTISSRQY